MLTVEIDLENKESTTSTAVTGGGIFWLVNSIRSTRRLARYSTLDETKKKHSKQEKNRIHQEFHCIRKEPPGFTPSGSDQRRFGCVPIELICEPKSPTRPCAWPFAGER